jgi:hypothetical protein
MRQRPLVVIVKDKMQRGYRYALTAPAGRNFDPAFLPELTPEEMLALGVFCGKYMTDCINASMPVSRCRCGATTAGFIPTIRAAGSNGTVATTWAAARRKRMRGK